MRYVASIVFAVIAASLGLAAPDAAQAPSGAAVDRLAKARAALGGVSELATIKSLALTVRGRDLLGSWPGYERAEPQYAESRTEVRILLPDHYLVATERFAPYPTKDRPWGFARNDNIGRSGPPSPTALESFGYLALPLLLRTETVFPFTLKAVQGNSLQFVDPNGVNVAMELDPGTHRPRILRYERLERTATGELTGRRFPMRVEIGDYRAVGSLRLAHTLRTFQAETFVQERRIDAIEINPRLTVSDFK